MIMNDMNFSQLWYYVGSLMLIDIVLGTLVAFKLKNIDSEESFNGVIKKAAIVLVLSFALLIEQVSKAPIFKITCVFYMIYESVSIVENAGILGLPLPKILVQAVNALKQNNEGKNGDTPN
jgi:toxin secretion/phage lysis holin